MIEVDYRYDTSGFFSADGNPEGTAGAAAARAALEAAANRWGEIIDQTLLAAAFNDDQDDPRIRFNHPSTGEIHEVSPAASLASDALVIGNQFVADEYRGSWGIPADTYVIYAGAYGFGDGSQDVEEVGRASTGFGENFVDVINNPLGPLYRGFTQPFPDGPRDNLPVWGGSVSFTTNPDTDWHFDHTSTGPAGTFDFYSIALHEIGHVLGQNTREWNNWLGHVSGFEFLGPETLAAIAADVGAPTPEINGGDDVHWFDGTANSLIFRGGSPNYQGTVGPETLQPSLMHGTLLFGNPNSRFEVTNLDAASLRDIGWSTVDGDLPLPQILEVIGFKIDPTLGGGVVNLSWAAAAGARFTVLTSHNLQDWKAVTPDVVADGESASWQDGDKRFSDPNPPAKESVRKYFRVISRSFEQPVGEDLLVK